MVGLLLKHSLSSEESGEWDPLESRLETLDGVQMVCAKTDALSLFAIFIAEADGSGCSIAAADMEGVDSAFNLLLAVFALLVIPGRRPDTVLISKAGYLCLSDFFVSKIQKKRKAGAPT